MIGAWEILHGNILSEACYTKSCTKQLYPEHVTRQVVQNSCTTRATMGVLVTSYRTVRCYVHQVATDETSATMGSGRGLHDMTRDACNRSSPKGRSNMYVKQHPTVTGRIDKMQWTRFQDQGHDHNLLCCSLQSTATRISIPRRETKTPWPYADAPWLMKE